MKNKPFILVFSLISLCCATLVAQRDTVVLTKNFQFEDGIYLTYEDFRNNQPTYVWDSLRVSLFSNPQTFLAQVQFIQLLEGEKEKSIDPEQIWGFSLGGIPYVRLPDGAVKKKLVTFAGMQLRGKICYFTYDDYEIVNLSMPVYNPVTRRPFLRGDVARKQLVTYERILLFETGETIDFTKEGLLEWIKEDSRLYKTVSNLSPTEAEEKLFKCLLIFDDRNPVTVEQLPQEEEEEVED